MSVEDDEIRIENLEAKLKLARKALKTVLDDLKESKRREAFGVLNPERRKAIIKHGTIVAGRVTTLQQELDEAYESAGLAKPQKKK